MSQTTYRTLTAELHVVGDGNLPKQQAAILQEVITLTGTSVQALLSLFQKGVQIEYYPAEKGEGELKSVDIQIPCRKGKVEAVKKLLSQTLPAAKFPGQSVYSNSYRIIGVSEETSLITCRVFERKILVTDKPDTSTGLFKTKPVDSIVPANFFQALLKTYLLVPFGTLPKMILDPVLKQVSEMVLSYVGLLAKGGQRPEFPSLGECSPDKKLQDWQKALASLALNVTGFERKPARDLQHFAPDDWKGNRLINVDPDWTTFVRSPFSTRLPLKITVENSVVHRRVWLKEVKGGKPRQVERLYLALQVFEGVDPSSKLAKLQHMPSLFWWHKHVKEFTPLGAWQDSKDRLNPKDKNTIVIPLEYDSSQRFEKALDAPLEREVCLFTLNERGILNPQTEAFSGRKLLRVGGRQYRGDYATSATVETQLHSRVLGIHFSDDPVIVWTLADIDGRILNEGKIGGNSILSEALLEKARIEVVQGKQRWVGGKTFSGSIKTRTQELARSIVELAIAHDAALALEEVTWAPKQSGESAANRRFSTWNYARLAEVIGWLGFDIGTRGDEFAGKSAPLIRTVSDFLTKFTCPHCGACRKAKQDKSNADTWREGKILHCRKCAKVGEIPGEYAAKLVALEGVKALKKLHEKAEEKTEQK